MRESVYFPLASSSLRLPGAMMEARRAAQKLFGFISEGNENKSRYGEVKRVLCI